MTIQTGSMKGWLFSFIVFVSVAAVAQPGVYTVGNLHSHNDYEKPFPFREAYNQGFGSIEADIFLRGQQIIVAHDTVQVKQGRTLDSLYLQPLQQCIIQNNGYPYADKTAALQLLIDIKRDSVAALALLIEKLKNYPAITSSPAVKIVITGNRPNSRSFASYPSYIYFDGELNVDYPAEALTRIVMLSDNFKTYSAWNGKGIIPAGEKQVLDSVIAKARRLKKKLRFWNAPDIINSWYGLMKLGVDYINTDQTVAAASFIRQLPMRSFTSASTYTAYKPLYRNDGKPGLVKNVILLIGDGTSFPQWYAGYTANRGVLNVFNMHFTGISKTSSFDSYITDSAPGSTAFSSGEKTNNRSVGVDHTGKAMVLLPDIVHRKKMKTGIITSGDITDATPADFYAHQSERSSSGAILLDLLQSPISILMGMGAKDTSSIIKRQLAKHFTIVDALEKVTADTSQKWLVTEKRAGLPVLGGRGDWTARAFDKSITLLSKNSPGFFLVVEGAQVDHGGHDNNLSFAASEVMDFDQVVGKAMAFADSNGQTLVVVTADHETGGLTLLDGDYNKGYVSGQFATVDHTALPVPVFAYGPGAQLFAGVYENTAVFYKILTALGLKK
jgi:alkaline phosphatase